MKDEPFWLRVERTEDCWLWRGAKFRTGYGRVTRRRKSVSAHRWAWFITSGRWPRQHVLHSCDVRACVNPAHLREGTHEENMREMVSKGRHVATRGESSVRSKVNNQTVNFIRASDESTYRLADMLGLGQTTVSRIRRRITWRHVP